MITILTMCLIQTNNSILDNPSSGAVPVSSSPQVQVEGRGFFRVMEAGRVEFARSGNIGAINGYLALNDVPFLPNIAIDGDLTNLTIADDGTVMLATQGQFHVLGKLVLAKFPEGEIMNKHNGFFICEDRPDLVEAGSALTDGKAMGKVSFVTASQQIKSVPTLRKTQTSESTPVVKLPSNENQTPQNSADQAPKSQSPIPEAKPVIKTIDYQKLPTASEYKQTIGKSTEIVVHPENLVAGESFTLGEIADISTTKPLLSKLNQIWIGNSPVIGYSRKIDESFIRLRLNGSGFNPETYTLIVPEDCTVKRASQTVTPEQMEASAQDAVSTIVGKTTVFSNSTPILPAVVPPGVVTITATEPMLSGSGYFVNLNILVDGKLLTTRSIMMNPASGTIGVNTGDIVTVEVTAGNATISVTGKVLSRAYVGQHVQVKIEGIGSKPTVQDGILTSSNKVSVKL